MWIAAIAAILLAVWPAGAQTLAGKVVEDHTGNPLASVELRVSKEGVRQLAADLETDTSGRFHAEGIPPGDYRVEVSKPNYATLRLGVKLGAEAKSLTLRLMRLGAISGRVADPEGHPIPGSRVAVMTRDYGGGIMPWQVGFSAVPGGDGQYRIHGLPPGEYAVAASYGAAMASGNGSEGRSAAGSGAVFYPNNQHPQWFSIYGGEDYSGTDFMIVATSLFKVSGVVQPAGKRYAVALTAIDQPLLAVASQRLDTDSGVFHLDGIPPGSYDLYASGPVIGYGGGALLGPEPVFGKVRVNVAGQDVEGVAVSVGRGRSASFILRAASPRQPASACPPTARLALSPVEATGAMLDRSVEANFAMPQPVDNLALVRYRVSLGPGAICYSEGALLDPAREGDEPIAVTVGPAASLRGRLIAGAAHASDFVVVLASSGPAGGEQQPVRVAYPDADSRFSFSDLIPGRYRIGAQPAGESHARWVADVTHMTELELVGGAPTEIDLPAPLARGNP